MIKTIRFFATATLLLTICLSGHPQIPAVYYVRLDGGSADNCNGLSNAPYPGSGTAQPCAWNHPFRALPPGGPPKIHGGDTLIIAPGSYMMGLGAPGAEACSSDFPWDCHIPPIPSGLNAAMPTRILGAGWDSGCSSPPQLWGTERTQYLLDLTNSSFVQVDCLELTDHSGCVESHSNPGLACQRDTYPYGPWAMAGLYAQDSGNVYLRNLNIHGLAHHGVWAARLTDWTVENVRIVGNGQVGWDGDIAGSDGDNSNSGSMVFRHLTVEWNGCAESYPGRQPVGCWGQEAGGYGDGIGVGTSGGHWVIEDSAVRHNTQDGIDLLYVRIPGSSIEIRRTVAEGNAGNQIKTSGPVSIENTIITGNCGFFHNMPGWNNGDDCRAAGDALATVLRAGNQASVVNSTLTGEGNCLMISTCQQGQSCNGTESVRLLNTIFLGQPRLVVPGENSCFAWYDNEPGNPLPQNPFAVGFTLITGARFGNVTPCGGAGMLCGTAPGLANPAIGQFDAHLVPGSAALDAGSNAGCPSNDIRGFPRPGDGNRDGLPVCDLGAYEGSMQAFYLPLLLRGSTGN